MNTIKEEDDRVTASETDSLTAQDYILSQIELEREAKKLMPYDPNTCTYIQGGIRQNVYACLTCSKQDSKQQAGICYSCSIQCHSKHELVELFSKRNFACDCGTTRMKANGACKLRSRVRRGSGASDVLSRRSSFSADLNSDPVSHPAEDIPSLSNRYNHNYDGVFCSCCEPYNPLQETGNMLQCHFGEVCGEDWFHDECIMGFKHGFMGDRRKKPGNLNEQSVNMLEKLPELGLEAPGNTKTEQDDDEDEDDAIPIEGFPKLDDFDCFICWKCVEQFRYALDELPESIILTKLPHVQASSVEEREAKLKGTWNDEKREQEDGPSLKKKKTDYNYSIFLKYEFRDPLVKIVEENKQEYKNLIRVLKLHPYLYKDDPIYEPEQDSDLDDDNSSMYDRGSELLNNLPREKAIESVRAYQDIKSKLTDFLRPFASNGKVVTEDEVRDFFKKVQDEQ